MITTTNVLVFVGLPMCKTANIRTYLHTYAELHMCWYLFEWMHANTHALFHFFIDLILHLVSLSTLSTYARVLILSRANSKA